MFFNTLELFEAIAYRLLSLVPDGAGVDKDKIGFAVVAGGTEPSVHENGGYHFAVGKVHGTAIALYVEPLFKSQGLVNRRGKSLALAGFIMCFIGHQIQHSLL